MPNLPGAPLARRVALLLALLLAGCIGPFSPSGTAKDLEDARRLWDRQQISSYRFRVHRLCFCAPAARVPMVVVVERGRVISITDAETGAPYAEDPFMPITVGALFAAIDDAIARDADRISVRYDPELGYPREIAMDFSERIADEEVTYFASDLVPMR